MKVDSSASYFLRQLALLLAGGALLAGCAIDEAGSSEVTFRDDDVPFTFRHPPSFTEAPVDGLNSRGDVVAVRALDKVSVVAVRRIPRTVAAARETRLRVLGRSVTSRVTPVEEHPGWALECQWTEDRRDEVREACTTATRTVRARRG